MTYPHPADPRILRNLGLDPEEGWLCTIYHLHRVVTFRTPGASDGKYVDLETYFDALTQGIDDGDC